MSIEENRKKEMGFPKNPDNITKDELHEHFDLNNDGKVSIEEYAEHINYHCDNPETLDDELQQADFERGFKYAKGGKLGKNKPYNVDVYFEDKQGNEYSEDRIDVVAKSKAEIKENINKVVSKRRGVDLTDKKHKKVRVVITELSLDEVGWEQADADAHKSIEDYAKGGKTEAEWLVILEGEDGFEIDEIVFAKSEDEAYNKAEKLNPNSYSRGINMLTDYDGSKVEYAKGGKTKEGKTWKEKYNKKYGNDLDASNSLSDIAEDTGVSKKGIQKIYNKGIGAYKTNPSSVRPNVKSKEQWAQARVYSAVMGGKAAKVDEKELKMERGGALKKEFKFDKNFVIYVPSTTDVGEKISKKELEERVQEVEKYVANEFGGYTETETDGGYKSTSGEIIEEDIVKVSVFANNKDWKKNENKVVKKVKDWSKKWGQEAIGFEFEGDLYYIDADGKFGWGGTILGALVGGYAGYKIGRARPQKKGFDTEKELISRAKNTRWEKDGGISYAKGGSVDGIRFDGKPYNEKEHKEKVRKFLMKQTRGDIDAIMDWFEITPNNLGDDEFFKTDEEYERASKKELVDILIDKHGIVRDKQGRTMRGQGKHIYEEYIKDYIDKPNYRFIYAKGGKTEYRRSKKVLQRIVDKVDIDGERPSTAYYYAKSELNSPSYAKGGYISMQERNEFENYLNDFYGKGGIYEDDYDGGFTTQEIAIAVDKYIQHPKSNWGGGDSVDRELTRDRFLIPEKYPNRKTEYKEGGEIDYFEEYERLEKEYPKIYNLTMEQGELESYEDTERLLNKLNSMGWTFDYGLDNSPFNLRKMDKGGALELVHAYDDDGSLFGTGHIEKVEGGKTYVRFDSQKVKVFDNEKVKKVMQRGGSLGKFGSGSIGDTNSIVNGLKKGDTIEISYGDVTNNSNNVPLKVRSRNKVRNGKIDKITFDYLSQPQSVKFYAYERGDGKWGFAKGDMAISRVTITKKYDKGGSVRSPYGDNKGVLTASKAKKMLDDGMAQGKPLTDRQKRYFGAISQGKADKAREKSSMKRGGKTKSINYKKKDYGLDYLYNQLKISRELLDRATTIDEKDILSLRLKSIQKVIDNTLRI